MQKDQKFAQLLNNIKDLHEKIHKSAIKIKDTYVAFDRSIDAMLAERWIDHLTWIKNLSTSLMGNTSFKGGTDPHKCEFGKWFYAYKATDSGFDDLLRQWESPHEKLHVSASNIVKEMEKGNLDLATKIYSKETLPALEELSGYYGHTMGWIDDKIKKQKVAVEIFESDTIPALQETLLRFKDIIRYFEGKADNAVLDMDNTFSQSRMLILIVSVKGLNPRL